MADPFDPFNARTAADTPYWLRNGLKDDPEVTRFIAEHRRRLGVGIAEERAVTDRLLEDISAGKISAAKAIPALQEWRKKHDRGE